MAIVHHHHLNSFGISSCVQSMKLILNSLKWKMGESVGAVTVRCFLPHSQPYIYPDLIVSEVVRISSSPSISSATYILIFPNQNWSLKSVRSLGKREAHIFCCGALGLGGMTELKTLSLKSARKLENFSTLGWKVQHYPDEIRVSIDPKTLLIHSLILFEIVLAKTRIVI